MRNRPKYAGLRFCVTAGLSLLFLGSAGFPSSAAELRILHGHVPGVAARLVPIGRLDATNNLSLAIGIPLRNLAALTNFLGAIYDPRNSSFHHFLTPAEFVQAFGPSQQDYERVVAFVRTNSLFVTQRHGNRVLLDVTGTVGAIEKALNIHLMVYRHPTENRNFYAPDREPSIGLDVPILDISGLDNFKLPRPLVHPATPARARPLFGSGAGGTYLGRDFRAAYAPNVGATGVGQTVGLLEFDGYYANDITSYETLAALPNVPLSNVLLDNFNGGAGSANIEVALDIEMAIAMAPGLSSVVIYEAGPKGIPNDILNRMASDNSAKQLSSSWSWSGGPSGTTDNIFLQLAAQGQSFFQAAGDSDAYSGAAPQPCDNPYITIVGGTILSTSGGGGSWVSEKTWNWYNNGTGTNGTGGGISTSYSIPSWQQSVSMSFNQGSTTMRNFPDVALTADNIWVTYNNGSSGAVGGTSCAAPLWAAYTALINQQALGNGRSVMGFINPSLYAVAQGSGYSSAFHDITSGNNTNSSSPNKFFAVPSFDLCTGWGTPAGNGLIDALAGAPTPQIVSNSLALVVESCTNNAVDPDETVTMSFSLMNVGSGSVTNLVATLQPSGGITSPSGPQTYGALAAGGAAVSRPFTFTATGACGGIATATLQLQDGASDLGTVSFTLRLGGLTTVTTFSENFDTTGAPALPTGWSTAVASGFLSAWMTTNGFSDTTPDAAFVADAGTAGQSELLSPVIPIQSATAQLTFRHNEDLAFQTIPHPKSTTYYDGGILEISIGGGAFTDIVAAGGSFSSGGYNCTLASATGNPFSGARAWGGNSGGWTTTTVVLPANAAGQNVQFKWVLGTGINASPGAGWFVDSVFIQDNTFDCCVPSADVAVSQLASPNPVAVGQNLVYTLTISNSGPSMASTLEVTNTLPANVSFVSASPGCINLGNAIACSFATLSAGQVSNVLVTVKPSSAGILTNTANITANPADPNSGNNTSIGTVTVEVPTAISVEPTNQVTTVGGGANFYVSATGTGPLTYQWTFGGNALTGATSSTLPLANVQANQAGNYAVVVANGVGSVTSVVATLTVLVPAAIVSQPTNETVALGDNTTFYVGATGSAPLNYQWMFAGSILGGATSSSLTLNNVQTNQAGDYAVLVSNSAGSATSAVATLTVLIPPAITQQPVNETTIVGSNATFQAAASGSTPLAYQWYFGGTTLSGQTATSLSLSNVQSAQAGNYQLVITNAAGTATSFVAQLTVLVPPTIILQPTNESVVSGGSVNFQVSASGTAPLGYQWWFNGTNAIGSDTNALTLGNVQPIQAGQYNVVITNNAGAVTSAVASLTVGIPPSITQDPSNLVVTQGQNASFTIAATGDAPLTYQWRFNGLAIATGTSLTCELSGVTSTNAGNYDAIVSNAYGAITSAVAQLTVLVPPTITSQPSNQVVAAGTDALFEASASGTAPLGYQWLFNATNMVGSDTNALSISNAQLEQAGSYCLVVTNSAGSVTSTVATLTIGIAPAILQQPVSLIVTQGQSATFDVATTGTDPIAYLWRVNGSALNGGNNSNYLISAANSTDAGDYDVVLSNAYGSVTSSLAQLTVLIPPTITNEPVSQTVIAGGEATFQVGVSGTGPLAYQWWFNGTNAIGADTNVLSVNGAQSNQAGIYTVAVTNAAGSVTSAVAQLTVLVPPLITSQPTNQSSFVGGSAGFYAVASGSGPLTYQWNYNGSALPGANSNTLLLSGIQATQAGPYVLVVSNAAGSIISSTANLKVLVQPSATDPQLTASGFSISVSSVAGLSYLLEYKNALQDPSWTATSTWYSGSGAILVLQDTNSASGARFYRVRSQ